MSFSGKLEELVKIARVQLDKRAFVDPGMAAGGGDPAAMGGDPMAAAGGGGGDPMAAMGGGGGDPMAAMGGDPMAAAGGGGGDPAMEARLAALEQQLSGGGGGAGGVEPIKPKIDVNVEIMQMKKLLARIADAQGIPIPASEMVATTQDLTQMGMEGEAGGAQAAGGQSAISPIDPMQGASPTMAKGGFDMFGLRDRASALAAVMKKRDG